MKFFLQIFLAFMLLSTSVSVAADFYVSNTGSDSASGDELTPWQTLQHAVDSITPGDTIVVQSGIYAGFRVKNSGEKENYCTIKAASTAIVTLSSPSLDSQNNAIVEIDTNVRYWNIKGFSISNGSNCSLHVNFASEIDFVELDISDSICGMFVKNSNDISVCNVRFAQNTGYALEIENSDNISVFNSLMYNNSAAVVFHDDCSSFRFANNTVFNESTDAPLFDFCNLTKDLFFVNNVVIAQAADTILLTFRDFNDFTINNNAYKGKFRVLDHKNSMILTKFKDFGYDSNSVEVEPEAIFMDFQNQNFNLQDNCNICELGIYYEEVYGISIDFAGNTRIEGYFPDLGAFEASVSSAADTDSDSLPNWWEHLKELDFLDAATPDEDDDLDDLTNFEEYVAGTLPRYGDSDADGYGDGDEKSAGTDPLDQYDFPVTIGITPETFEALNLRSWFKYKFHVVNYKTPLKFEIVDGILAPGIDFDGSNGKLSGYAARPGTFNFVIRVTDAEQKTDTQKVQLIVNLPAETKVTGCCFNPDSEDSNINLVLLLVLMLVFARIAGISRKS